MLNNQLNCISLVIALLNQDPAPAAEHSFHGKESGSGGKRPQCQAQCSLRVETRGSSLSTPQPDGALQTGLGVLALDLTRWKHSLSPSQA